jgi:hypothetical protein
MMTQAKSSSQETAPVLADLPKIPYLTAEGLISEPGVTSQVIKSSFNRDKGARLTQPRVMQVKASVYAVSDEAGRVAYIGVSRSVAQSLRLHLARVPDQTYSYQVRFLPSLYLSPSLLP